MKQIVVLFIILSSNITFAQTITIKEMLDNFKCTNVNCFNSFILKKGFKFKEKSKYTAFNDIGYEYASIERFMIEDSLRENEVTIEFVKEKLVEISFVTEEVNQYNEMLNQLRNLGFTGEIHNYDNHSSGTLKSDSYKKIFFSLMIYGPTSMLKMGVKDKGSVNRYSITILSY